MNEGCSECIRLKQATDDAMRVETIMLARKFMASSNGNTILLKKMEPLLLEASELRRQARRALYRHEAAHAGEKLTPTHDSARIMSKRAAGK